MSDKKDNNRIDIWLEEQYLMLKENEINIDRLNKLIDNYKDQIAILKLEDSIMLDDYIKTIKKYDKSHKMSKKHLKFFNNRIKDK